MAHGNPLLVEAIAEQLLGELQVYEELLEELRAERWSTVAALVVAGQGDRVQRCAENLRPLVARVADFLITRMQLSRRLVGSAQGREQDLLDLHAEHLHAVHTLRLAALRLARRPAG